jgi:hypothetical protein
MAYGGAFVIAVNDILNLLGLTVAVGTCIFIVAMAVGLSHGKHHDAGYYVRDKEPKE